MLCVLHVTWYVIGVLPVQDWLCFLFLREKWVPVFQWNSEEDPNFLSLDFTDDLVINYKKFKSWGVIKVVEEGVSESVILSYLSSFQGIDWGYEVKKMDDHSWLASFPSKDFL